MPTLTAWPARRSCLSDKAKAAGKPVEVHVLTDYAQGPAWKRETNAQQHSLISDYRSKGCCGGGL